MCRREGGKGGALSAGLQHRPKSGPFAKFKAKMKREKKKNVSLLLTKTQNEFVLGHHCDDFGSLEIVKQHFQAEQLDGGEGSGRLDAGVQTHPRRSSRAVKSWSA